ncbi:alpha/beta fold hydrolase [Gottfriedia solisilvae]|uniref:alpha/beta fold hydrolase n=1 Tax=Gottfriedia solisilvae TaxID=1516104 RepID=UPI003D2F0429
MKPIQKKKIFTNSGMIEFAQLGEGVPTVVLINGGSGPIEGWYKVFHELAEETTVLAYNRLGVGKSDLPKSPQHGISIVNTLRQLLKEINVSPPYILVGHSLGGLYANLFARQYPEEIAGVVLLDASHPEDVSINETQGALIRGINKFLKAFDSFSSHKKWNEVNFVEETAKQIQQAGSFPDVPLLVLSGDKMPKMMPEHAFQIRRANQMNLVQLSNQGKHILATKSGHFPQLSEPELVISAIQECIQMAKNN